MYASIPPPCSISARDWSIPSPFHLFPTFGMLLHLIDIKHFCKPTFIKKIFLTKIRDEKQATFLKANFCFSIHQIFEDGGWE